MSQDKLQTMVMQKFWGVIEVYYGIVQVVNSKHPEVAHFQTRWSTGTKTLGTRLTIPTKHHSFHFELQFIVNCVIHRFSYTGRQRF